MSEMRFDDPDYGGKTVLITGAAGGFGAQAARRFAAAGARLALSDVDMDGLEALAEALRAEGCDVLTQWLDVSDETAVAAHLDQVKQRFGGLDVAINNAGIAHDMAPLAALDLASFERVWRINTQGVFLCMKHEIPLMGQGAAILNVSSAAGLLGASQMAGYAASKHAVIGLTRTAADELAPQGIRVNAICPSFAETPMVTEMADILADRYQVEREQTYARITARVPMRRIASADEIVQAMLWICAPQNSFMTGQAISIDGGLTAV